MQLTGKITSEKANHLFVIFKYIRTMRMDIVNSFNHKMELIVCSHFKFMAMIHHSCIICK